MKKIIIAGISAILITASLAGCGNDPLNTPQNTTAATEASQSATPDTVSQQNYEDTFQGLVNYFADCKYIETDEAKVTKMDAELIGAAEGNRYVTAYNNANVIIELYAFDTAALNETGKKVINSVKETGKFQIMDLEAVPACLSDSGKYLMIYTDQSIHAEDPDTGSENYKRQQTITEEFKQFPDKK